MDFERLKNAWQEQNSEVSLPQPRLDALEAVWSKAEELRRVIIRRDRREGAAALFVLLFFGGSLFFVKPLLARVGAVVLMISAVLILVVLRRARPGDVPRHLPLREAFQNELRAVERQIRLLHWVPLWYIAPLMIGVNLFVVGRMGPGSNVSIGYAVFTALLAVFLWRLNARAVRVQLLPVKKQLEDLIDELSQPES